VSEADSVTTENRRLQREVRALRERVAALESSRWWRLHPRFVARRVAAALPGQRAREGTRPAPTVERRACVDPLVTRFREEFAGREWFADDWFSGKYTAWQPILVDLEGRTVEVLEIGSFEGLSACYLLWRLPQARVTCIDTFAGSAENAAYGVSVNGLEERFDRNVALVDAARVEKLVGESGRVLPELVAQGRRFDLVYVDGSHHALDVLVDASLAWRLLAPGGVIIFDDYEWAKLGTDPLLRPGAAIDAFLSVIERHGEVLFRQRQIAVQKGLNAA
jgi:predicted O-methyltransferase YrrM